MIATQTQRVIKIRANQALTSSQDVTYSLCQRIPFEIFYKKKNVRITMDHKMDPLMQTTIFYTKVDYLICMYCYPSSVTNSVMEDCELGDGHCHKNFSIFIVVSEGDFLLEV